MFFEWSERQSLSARKAASRATTTAALRGQGGKLRYDGNVLRGKPETVNVCAQLGRNRVAKDIL